MTASIPVNRFSETKFSESFWSNSRGDYVTGINVLHSKMDQGVVEDQEILTYLRERIDVEQRYGNALIEMGNRRLKLEGFLRDDGASLRKTFETIKNESIGLGNGHISLANNLKELVLAPLVKFNSQVYQTTQQSREDIENRLKLFDKHLLDLDRSHAAYVAKCNTADQAEMEANKIAAEDAAAHGSPPSASSDNLDVERRHEFASQRFTILELNKFLNKMRAEVPSQDVKVPIMGVYNNCCTGSAIAHWIQQNTKARTIEEAEHIGQSLSDEGFLRLIGQRGNRFLASPANFYQWRDQMFELLDEDDREEEMSLVKRTKQEVEKADASYLAAVKKADLTRLQLEVGLFSHMDLLQRCEYERINTFKNAFLNFAAIFSNIISITQSVADHLLIFQEALRPANDVQYVIEQYRTGAFVPMPTLYNHFYLGSGYEQVFGVNIEQHCNFTRKKVPQLVTKCLSRIKKSSVALTNEQKVACWTAEVPLSEIHTLRNKINHGGKITQKLLRLFDVATVIGVLRLYFLELPGSLLNGDEYETVKIIYSSGKGRQILRPSRTFVSGQLETRWHGAVNLTDGDFIAVQDLSDDVNDSKNDARISSIRNLLALLSAARFYTLYEVVKHVSNLIKETSADDDFTHYIAHRWGPVFLRPIEETAVTLHDKHPQRMMRDMLKMTHQIFEPIRMSREEGNLSRSVTTRAPATHLGRNRKGAVRHSRDLKSSPVSPTSNGHAGPGMPSIAVEGQVIPENAIAAAVAAAADNGSGVGATPPKLVRRPPPSRFNLTRYVSAPEMFSEQSASKKKPLLNGTAENGDAQTPGLLNTTGLKPAAGGDKSSRSPLRQSVMAVEETPEEEDEEDTAIANAMAAEAAAATATPEIEAEVEAEVEAEAEVTSPAVESVAAAPEEDVQAVAIAEPESTAAEAVAVSTNSSGEQPQEWKAVTGQEFEASGRKLERRRKNRQSSLGPNGTAANGVAPETNGLSAESVLQALREEGN
ncbi:hypothetical protein KI688_003273 [Linnemannia hyalina]|uniref:Uncharacterized protein n=1 Tax=Linnemannia hyalina TaxID=64524 RepID=A0A9P7XPZ3_9FUNG|nr:hypothetical protein KI688_003273 [Linnemannia hyalina]